MIDCVIKNGTVVTPNGLLKGGLGVDKGLIVAVGPDETLPTDAGRIIDAKGLVVIPGFVEVHAHVGMGHVKYDFQESWRLQWETESEAAIHGGVTTFRTNLSRNEPYLPIIDEYIEWAAANSYVDFGIYPALTQRYHVDEIVPMAEKGMPHWKAFYDPYQGDEGIQIGVGSCDSANLWLAFERFREAGIPGIVLIHAEEFALYKMIEARLKEQGRTDMRAWSESRPSICEAMKIEAGAMICREAGQGEGASLYIVHLSTREGADIIKKYQSQGLRILAETCPSLLTHTMDDGDKVGVWGKVNPPFRAKEDHLRLWAGLREGTIAAMGTDHCAYPQEDKEGGGGKFGNVWNAMPGICGGVQHWLPVLFTEGVLKNHLSLEQMVKICCENNAKIFGHYPQKGVLQPGSDADVVIFDPETKKTIGDGFYKGLNKTFSLYWGDELRGFPVLTMSRGEVVMENGKTVAKKGRGKFVPSFAAHQSNPS